MKHSLEATKSLLLEAEFHSATAQIAQRCRDGIVLLRRLSASGYIPASYELGNCFYIGNLVERNEHKAIKKWREAASGGHIYANINVLKYEWYFASYLRKIFLLATASSILIWGVWLIFMSNGHDPRLIGNTDPSLKR